MNLVNANNNEINNHENADLVPLQIELSEFILQKTNNETLVKIIILLWQALLKGQSCIKIASLQTIFENQMTDEELINYLNQHFNEHFPNLLVLQGKWLYLAKYFRYEQQIAERIQKFLQQAKPTLAPKLIDNIKLLFSDNAEQKQAAFISLSQPFSIISGGPGTGKTTTIAKIIILLLQNNPRLKIALAAPTGKAAQRLNESLQLALSKINNEISSLGLENLSPELLNKIKRIQAHTLHKLLVSNDRSPQGIQTVLPYDLVVIDETSMVDLNIMARLFRQLKPKAQLILLGDKNQLDAIGIGGIFTSLCKVSDELARKSPELAFVSNLKKSHRFDDSSHIGQTAQAILHGDIHKSLELLHAKACLQHPDNAVILTQMLENYAPFFIEVENLKKLVSTANIRHISIANYLQQSPEINHQIKQIFIHFNEYRVLVGMRQGQFGVEKLNELFLQKKRREFNLTFSEKYFTGMMIMVTQNDYDLQLFNGDIGLILVINNEIFAIFETNLHQKNQSTNANLQHNSAHFRALTLKRLPIFEATFAMTIHKSQGSEFSNIDVILGNQHSSLFNRSLLYTALTRAKSHFNIYANDEIITNCINSEAKFEGGFSEYLFSLLI